MPMAAEGEESEIGVGVEDPSPKHLNYFKLIVSVKEFLVLLSIK